MEAILIILIFLVLVAVWICLPFIPAVDELLKKKDIEPVQVEQESEVDIRFFARGYRTFMDRHLAEAVSRCRSEGGDVRGKLEDGTDYIVLDGSERQEPPPIEKPGEPSETMILSCGRLRLPAGNEYLLELWAGESVEGGEGNIYRAVLAEEAVNLGPRSTVLRWLHGERSVSVGEGSELWGRVSAGERIALEPESRFERLNAPDIAFGEPIPIELRAAEGEPLEPDDIPRLIDDTAGRWLVKGKLEVPENRRVENDLVATGEGRIGDRAHISGSIKSHKDLHLGSGVVVEGSVVSGRDIHLGEGCRIKGPVLAERTLFVERGCVLGAPDGPTTVSARRAEIAPGARAHGTFWAHEQGRITGQSGKED
jgi:cytoskeletal protein CcmA (bactofilin family)